MRRPADVRHGVQPQPMLKLGNGQFAILLVVLAALFGLLAVVLLPMMHSAAALK